MSVGITAVMGISLPQYYSCTPAQQRCISGTIDGSPEAGTVASKPRGEATTTAWSATTGTAVVGRITRCHACRAQIPCYPGSNRPGGRAVLYFGTQTKFVQPIDCLLCTTCAALSLCYSTLVQQQRTAYSCLLYTDCFQNTNFKC